MEAVFLKILNMSITASYLVLAVILARLLLKKAPKFITVILWGLVAVRLVCPFSFESVLSLIPSSETVPDDIMYAQTPQIYSGIPQVNTVVNNVVMPSFTPNATDSTNPLQIVVFIASVVWIVGIAAMLLYTIISYARIRFNVHEAVKLEGNLYECDRIASPFILGVIKPKIYLPSDMAECDREYVVAHEHAHIKRRDHLWKPLGFLLLAVYWFNPVLWVAYILLCRDIELACDEKVIKQMGEQNKKPYSDALINCSVPRKMIAACPVAFGETGVKGRIKSVLNYKKPAFWVIITAVVLSIAVAVCFMTNPLATEIVNLKGDIDYNKVLSDADAITVIKGDVQYSVSYEVDIAEIVEQLKKVKVNKEPISSSNDKFTNGIITDRYSLWFSEDFSEFCGKDVISNYWPQSYRVTNPKAAEKVFDIISDSESNRINTNLAVNNIQIGSDIPGLSISVKQISLNVDEPYIEVEFNNQNDQEYTYGNSFRFFYEQNGEWSSCLTFKSTETRKRVVTLPAIMIEPKGISTKKYSLRWYDLSKEGKYRFETQVSGWNTWVEFELKELVTTEENDNTQSIEKLKDKYPEYFGLDTTNGLEVYVSQFAENNYQCQLYSGLTAFLESKEMNPAKTITLQEMKLILSTYDVPSEDIIVIPYYNPLSSYYYKIDETYVENIKSLFDGNVKSYYIFNATVLEVYSSGKLLIEPFADEDERKSSDKITLSPHKIETYGVDSFKVGDNICIVYDGTINESYPAYLPNAYFAYLIQDTD